MYTYIYVKLQLGLGGFRFLAAAPVFHHTNPNGSTGPSEPVVYARLGRIGNAMEVQKVSMFPPKSNRFGTFLTPPFAIPRNSRPAQTSSTGSRWHRHVYRRSWVLNQCQHHRSSFVSVSEEMTASSLDFSSMDPFQILDQAVAQTQHGWYSKYLSHPSIQPSNHRKNRCWWVIYKHHLQAIQVPEILFGTQYDIPVDGWHLGCIKHDKTL